MKIRARRLMALILLIGMLLCPVGAPAEYSVGVPVPVSDPVPAGELPDPGEGDILPQDTAAGDALIGKSVGAHSLFIGTDRHDNSFTPNTGRVPTLLRTADQWLSQNRSSGIEAVCFGGDNVAGPAGGTNTGPKNGDTTFQYSTSQIDAEVLSVLTGLSASDIYYTYGSHDGQATDINTAFLGRGSCAHDVERSDYYIYGLDYMDVIDYRTGVVTAQQFLSWASNADPSKPVFVVSHIPLHAARGDQTAAQLWVNTLNRANDDYGLDLVFVFGHNHTTEGMGAVYYEKGSTLNVQRDNTNGANEWNSGSKNGVNMEIRFTYLNGGYMVASKSDPQCTAYTVDTAEQKLYIDRFNLSGFVSTKTVTLTGGGSQPPVGNTCTVSVNSPVNGTARLSATSAEAGTNVTLTLAPATGYELDTLTDNGTDVTSQVANGVYTIRSIAADHTLSVSFRAVTSGEASAEIRNADGFEDGKYYIFGRNRTDGNTSTNWLILSTNVDLAYDTGMTGNFTNVTEVPENALWKAETSGSGFALFNESEGVYLGVDTNGNLTTGTAKGSAYWTVSSGTKVAYSAYDGTLYYSGSNSKFKLRSGSSNGSMNLFEYIPRPAAAEKSVDITAGSSGATASASIAVGETITISLTNGSSYNSKSFTAVFDPEGTAELVNGDDASFELAASATRSIRIRGVKDGTTTIRMVGTGTNGSNDYSAFVTLTVGEGGSGDEPGKQLDITASSSGATANALIAVGETLSINLTNGSGNSKTYSVAIDPETVAEAEQASCEIAGNGTGMIKVTGLKNGSATVTITAPGNSGTYKATIDLMVGTGISDDSGDTTKRINITSRTEGASAEASIAVGEMITINLTNGSSVNTKDFTVTISPADGAELVDSADESFSLSAGETKSFQIRGLKDAEVTVQMDGTGGNTYSATVILTVKSDSGNEHYEPDRVWTETGSFEDGGTYAIAVHSGSSWYLLGAVNGAPKSVALSYGDGSLTDVPETALWEAASCLEGFSLYNRASGKYLEYNMTSTVSETLQLNSTITNTGKYWTTDGTVGDAKIVEKPDDSGSTIKVRGITLNDQYDTTRTNEFSVTSRYEDVEVHLFKETSSAEPEARTWTVSVNEPVGGTAVLSETTASEGSDVTLSLVPAFRYELDTLTDNGTDVKDRVRNRVYTIHSIDTDHTITVSFKPMTGYTEYECFIVSNGYALGNRNGTLITANVNVISGEVVLPSGADEAEFCWSVKAVSGYDSGSYMFVNDGMVITHVDNPSGTGESVAPTLLPIGNAADHSVWNILDDSDYITTTVSSGNGGMGGYTTCYLYYSPVYSEFRTHNEASGSTSSHNASVYPVNRTSVRIVSGRDSLILNGDAAERSTELTAVLTRLTGDVVWSITEGADIVSITADPADPKRITVAALRPGNAVITASVGDIVAIYGITVRETVQDTFVSANGFMDGREYVIAWEEDGERYLLNAEGASVAAYRTSSEEPLTSVPTTALWRVIALDEWWERCCLYNEASGLWLGCDLGNMHDSSLSLTSEALTTWYCYEEMDERETCPVLYAGEPGKDTKWFRFEDSVGNFVADGAYSWYRQLQLYRRGQPEPMVRLWDDEMSVCIGDRAYLEWKTFDLPDSDDWNVSFEITEGQDVVSLEYDGVWDYCLALKPGTAVVRIDLITGQRTVSDTMTIHVKPGTLLSIETDEAPQDGAEYLLIGEDMNYNCWILSPACAEQGSGVGSCRAEYLSIVEPYCWTAGDPDELLWTAVANGDGTWQFVHDGKSLMIGTEDGSAVLAGSGQAAGISLIPDPYANWDYAYRLTVNGSVYAGITEGEDGPYITAHSNTPMHPAIAFCFCRVTGTRGRDIRIEPTNWDLVVNGDEDERSTELTVSLVNSTDDDFTVSWTVDEGAELVSLTVDEQDPNKALVAALDVGYVVITASLEDGASHSAEFEIREREYHAYPRDELPLIGADYILIGDGWAIANNTSYGIDDENGSIVPEGVFAHYNSAGEIGFDWRETDELTWRATEGLKPGTYRFTNGSGTLFIATDGNGYPGYESATAEDRFDIRCSGGELSAQNADRITYLITNIETASDGERCCWFGAAERSDAVPARFVFCRLSDPDQIQTLTLSADKTELVRGGTEEERTAHLIAWPYTGSDVTWTIEGDRDIVRLECDPADPTRATVIAQSCGTVQVKAAAGQAESGSLGIVVTELTPSPSLNDGDIFVIAFTSRLEADDYHLLAVEDGEAVTITLPNDGPFRTAPDNALWKAREGKPGTYGQKRYSIENLSTGLCLEISPTEHCICVNRVPDRTQCLWEITEEWDLGNDAGLYPVGSYLQYVREDESGYREEIGDFYYNQNTGEFSCAGGSEEFLYLYRFHPAIRLTAGRTDLVWNGTDEERTTVITADPVELSGNVSWQVTEGSDVVSLTEDEADPLRVNVTALRAGTARINASVGGISGKGVVIRVAGREYRSYIRDNVPVVGRQYLLIADGKIIVPENVKGSGGKNYCIAADCYTREGKLGFDAELSDLLWTVSEGSGEGTLCFTHGSGKGLYVSDLAAGGAVRYDDLNKLIDLRYEGGKLYAGTDPKVYVTLHEDGYYTALPDTLGTPAEIELRRPMISYAVSVNTPDHGTAELSASSAPEGTDVTLTLTPEEGYEVDFVRDGLTDVTSQVVEGIYTIRGIDAAHQLTVGFRRTEVRYHVTVNEPEHGRAVLSERDPEAGTDVELYLLPQSGYVITSLADGDTDVTDQVVDGVYTIRSISADHVLTVTFAKPGAATSVTLDPAERYMLTGTTFTPAVSVLPADAPVPVLSWSSSDENVAAVTDGVITACAPGDAVITATAADDPGITASITVHVADSFGELSLSRTSLTMYLSDYGSVRQLSVEWAAGVEVQPVTWASTDPDTVTVDSTGLLTAKQAGTAIITATAGNGIAAACTVTVSGDALPLMEMPAAMKEIGEESFSGNPVIRCVILPDGAESIGAYAFEDCTALTVILIPDTVETIAETAFDGCEQLCILCGEGSAAQTWAEAHGIESVLLGE